MVAEQIPAAGIPRVNFKLLLLLLLLAWVKSLAIIWYALFYVTEGVQAFVGDTPDSLAQTAEAAEYTDCVSAEG